MTVEGPDGPRQFALPNTSPINVYNALSAVALLAEFGLAKDRIAQCMDQLTIVESRFSKVELKGRGLVLHLAKPTPWRTPPGFTTRTLSSSTSRTSSRWRWLGPAIGTWPCAC